MNAYHFTRVTTSAVGLLLIVLLSVSAQAQGLPVNGFVQGLWGGGLHKKNPTISDYSASEVRLQLRLEQHSGGAEFFARTDFVYDDVVMPDYQWELREAFVKFTLLKVFDFKVGRQISTWGTGDLIFINDVFAKDYESFFAGRDDQYLKAPQTSLRVEYYSPVGTFAVIWSPRFTPNRIPDGQRFSYYNPFSGTYTAGEPYLQAVMPSQEWENSEIAGRYQHVIAGLAFALYAYRGFFKNPVGFDPELMMPYFPKLNVFGASMRGQMAGGVFWIEGGYFQSREDSDGRNPLVPNRNLQGLIGYERQVATDLTVNLQYQAELMLDYDNYRQSLVGSTAEDELRSLITSRITRNFSMETVKLSSFVFWSPSDQDLYYRFSIDWKYTDAVTLSFGANLFDGKKKHTDFGAFALNDNVYTKVTFGF